MSNVSSRALAAASAGLLGLGSPTAAGFPIRVDAGRMLMKATTSIEGGQRCVYFQASTETRDYQGERVLAKALVESIPYFLRHGRIDLDHASVEGQIRGQRVDPYAFEVGRPIDARAAGDAGVMVKAAIYSSREPGTGNKWTESADYFWDSITKTNPPVLWYPSVQGMVTNEAGVVAADGQASQEIRGLLWQTVGLSRNPVSTDVPAITTIPLRVFAKAFGSVRGMSDLLAGLRGQVVSRPAVPTESEISDAQLQEVIEAFADAHPGQAPATVLGALEARGIPQDRALAVMFALISSPF